MDTAPKTIAAYIKSRPKQDRPQLEQLYEIIKQAAPAAKEKISWGMPTFTLGGNLIHFADHKAHTGLYPGPEAIEKFSKELEKFKTSKGAIQLPKDEPLPQTLIEKIVAFNIKRNTE